MAARHQSTKLSKMNGKGSKTVRVAAEMLKPIHARRLAKKLMMKLR